MLAVAVQQLQLRRGGGGGGIIPMLHLLMLLSPVACQSHVHAADLAIIPLPHPCSPAHHPIAADGYCNYSADSLDRKRQCKEALQRVRGWVGGWVGRRRSGMVVGCVGWQVERLVPAG